MKKGKKYLNRTERPQHGIRADTSIEQRLKGDGAAGQPQGEAVAARD